MCNYFKKDLGKHLKELRIKKRYTQKKLSLESTISRSHIAMIENGKRDITISALFKISRALNIPLVEIFSFDNLDKYKFDIEEFYK